MLVLQFKGGLGNQLFEYAYYRALIESGKDVKLDYSFFVDKEWAYKINLFPQVKGINRSKHYSRFYYYQCGVYRKVCRILQKVYVENVDEEYDKKALDVRSGLVTGYFQNYIYFDSIKELIRKELEFPVGEEILTKYIEELDSDKYASIHVRRMDYLELSDIYGGICDEIYYQNAIEYLIKREKDLKFLIFSDDPDWVIENMDIPNSICFSAKKFNHYDDWYDMCLMSHCKHNIIANSSFSWWGAWLNNYPNKIVICPKRWDNLHPRRGIACDGWVQM